MRFLIDVNARGAVQQYLADRGHDVILVSDRDTRMPDRDILAWALADERILITTDNDFEELICRQRLAHCGVLRLENLPRGERIQLLDDVLRLFATKLQEGCVIIADKSKYRIRTFK